MASARDKDSPARTRSAISFQDNSDRDESTNSETSETDIPEPLDLEIEKKEVAESTESPQPFHA
jgi:hypothetical protein